MNDPLLPITIPEPIIPEEVNDPITEDLAANAFAAFVKAVRAVEAQRLEKTRPLNDVIKDYIAAEKSLKAPMEEGAEKVAALLEAYRLSPAVQEKLASVRMLKKDFREAEKAGDVEGLALIGAKIEAAEVRPSIAVNGGSARVQFRVGIELLEIDEAQLPDRYFKRVLDEKAVKEDIELLGAVKGVEHRWTYRPSFVEKSAS